MRANLKAHRSDHVVTYDEVHGWPKDDRKQILDLGLLRRVEDATSLSCEACGTAHDCDMVAQRQDEAVVRCPNLGLMRVPRHRLQCWEVDLEHLASLLASAIKSVASIQIMVPGRIWLDGLAACGKTRFLTVAAR